MTTKVCTKCKVEKDVGGFNKDKNKRGGFSNICKTCKRKYYDDTHPNVKHRVIKKYAPGFKVCSICGLEKETNEFTKDSREKDGFHYKCKKCKSEYRITSYHIKNPNSKYARTYTGADGFKICTKCEIEKPISGFSSMKNSKDGHAFYCKECDAARMRERRRDPELMRKDYDSCRKNMRRKRKDPDYMKYMTSYLKEWKKTPQGRSLSVKWGHKRRDKKKLTECNLTLKQWNKILKMQKNKCAICDCEFSDDLKPTRDHIIPLSLGGGLTFGNIQALCGSCNSRKHTSVYFTRAITELLVDEPSC